MLSANTIKGTGLKTNIALSPYTLVESVSLRSLFTQFWDISLRAKTESKPRGRESQKDKSLLMTWMATHLKVVGTHPFVMPAPEGDMILENKIICTDKIHENRASICMHSSCWLQSCSAVRVENLRRGTYTAE